jgi:hypothetical protein
MLAFPDTDSGSGEKGRIESLDNLMYLAELNIAERFELESLRRQIRKRSSDSADGFEQLMLNESTQSTHLCQICGDEGLTEADGILCSHPEETQRHFLCNSCMTSYVKSLNNDPTDSLFHQRQGRILCPSRNNE